MSRRLLVLNERDPRHPQAGGAEVHLREIFRRLAAAGDAVTLLATACACCGSAPAASAITRACPARTAASAHPRPSTWWSRT